MSKSNELAPDSVEAQELNPRIGLLGELAVEMQIVQHGWHPVRLDTAQMASNADLIAVIQLQHSKAPTESLLFLLRPGGHLRAFLHGLRNSRQPLIKALQRFFRRF